METSYSCQDDILYIYAHIFEHQNPYSTSKVRSFFQEWRPFVWSSLFQRAIWGLSHSADVKGVCLKRPLYQMKPQLPKYVIILKCENDAC